MVRSVDLERLLKKLLPVKKEYNQRWPQIALILIATISATTSGLLFAWPSPSMPILLSDRHPVNFTLEEVSYLVIVSPLTGVLFSQVLGKIVDTFGRKVILMLSSIPHFVSFVLMATSETFATYFVAMFIGGIGTASCWLTLPPYIGETAEPAVRGSWGGLITTGSFFGVFLMNIIGSYYDIKTTATICSFFPLVFFCFIVFAPESPYHYIGKGQHEKARRALMTLRWNKLVDHELDQLTADVERQNSESGTFKDMFAIRSNRKALLIVLGVRFTNLFCGMTAFTIYTQYMFQEAGGHISSRTSSIIFTGILVIVIFISSFCQDKFGRRLLMIFSSLGCGVILTLESIYFYIKIYTEIDTSAISWLPLAGMVLFIFTYCFGLGTINNLIPSELFSVSIKGKALATVMIFTGFSLCAVNKLFQNLMDAYGLFGPFTFYAICCYAGAIFSYKYVLETRGKTLEEIQQDLKRL